MAEDFCVICNREMTNPVCARCNLHHLLLWINDKKLNLDSRLKLMKYIKENLFIYEDSTAICILCRQNEVHICTYCFFKKIENMLSKINLPEENEEDFKLSFNYRIYSDYPVKVSYQVK